MPPRVAKPKGAFTQEDYNGPVPREYLCSLTNSIMTDPVTVNGQNFDRQALIEAVTEYPHLPDMEWETFTPDDARKLETNRSLLNAINAYRGNAAPAGPPPSAQMKVEILVTRAIFDGNSYVQVRFKPSQDVARPPIAFICVLDLSESMNEEAMGGLKDSKGNPISWTRLQMLQYATKMLIDLIDGGDSISVVAFGHELMTPPSGAGGVWLPRTHLNTDDARKAAKTAIDRCSARGRTDFGVGLTKAFELASQVEAGTNVNILFFTDGVPTQGKGTGGRDDLQEWAAAQMEGNRWTLSTFSFGMDRCRYDMLHRLADWGYGVYGYCPVPGLVVATFVQWASMALCTVAQRCKIEILFDGKPVFPPDYDEIVRNVYLGHPINLVFPGNPRQVVASIDLGDGFGGQFTSGSVAPQFGQVKKIGDRTLESLIVPRVTDQVFRSKLIVLLRKVVEDKDLNAARAAVQQLARELRAQREITEFMRNLRWDLVVEGGRGAGAAQADAPDVISEEGKIFRALEEANWGVWGEGEMRSMLSYHESEFVGVLTDQALQEYQSPIFAIKRQKAWAHFVTMPGPIGLTRIRQGAEEFVPIGVECEVDKGFIVVPNMAAYQSMRGGARA